MMSSISVLQSQLDATSAQMDMAVAVAKKAKDIAEVQGQATMQLIDSASAVSTTSGANAVARGTGTILDVLV